MHLLVIRPEPDGSETLAKLKALGHTGILAPMLEIAFAIPPKSVPPPAAILFTSRNAVRALERWPAIAEWRDRVVFAVGPETASLAREYGFADVRVGGGDAKGLVALVEAEFDKARGTILYPAARNRSADIDAMLTERGFAVQRIEAYRAVAAKEFDERTIDALKREAVDGVLLFSRRSAATFVDAAAKSGVEALLPRIAFYVISEEAAAPLHVVTGAKIRIAERPDGESLFALLFPRG